MVKPRSLLVCVLLAVTALGCGDDDGDSTTAPLLDAGNDPHAGMDGGGDDASGCAAGRSVACTGPGGCMGGQVCRADGSFGECACDRAGPAPIGCSPAGTLALCVGPNACGGLQTCGEDGRFEPCECPARPTNPDRSVTALEITAPAADANVLGSFDVTGTAEGHVAAVYVSVGGGPLLIAEGTEQWSLRFDPGMLPYGPITIVALAVGEDGGELQRWIQVQNTDPLVGTWYRTSSSSTWETTSAGDYCVITLEANGSFFDRDCDVYGALSGGYNTWQRLYGDVIAFRYGQVPDANTVIAVVSDDGEELVITLGNSYWHVIEEYTRVHGDAPPRPDPLEPPDGGFDPTDAGFEPQDAGR